MIIAADIALRRPTGHLAACLLDSGERRDFPVSGNFRRGYQQLHVRIEIGDPDRNVTVAEMLEERRNIDRQIVLPYTGPSTLERLQPGRARQVWTANLPANKASAPFWKNKVEKSAFG